MTHVRANTEHTVVAKILPPLHFFQIMYLFFQKIVEILKYFVIHVYFFGLQWNKTNKSFKIMKSQLIPHRNPKMAQKILLAPFRSC